MNACGAFCLIFALQMEPDRHVFFCRVVLMWQTKTEVALFLCTKRCNRLSLTVSLSKSVTGSLVCDGFNFFCTKIKQVQGVTCTLIVHCACSAAEDIYILSCSFDSDHQFENVIKNRTSFVCIVRLDRRSPEYCYKIMFTTVKSWWARYIIKRCTRGDVTQTLKM